MSQTLTLTVSRGDEIILKMQVTIPDLALTLPNFPPSLGSSPLPQLPNMNLPAFSLDLGSFAFNPPTVGSGRTTAFPKIELPEFPPLSLPSVPFPPSLGSLPAPRLPNLGSLNFSPQFGNMFATNQNGFDSFPQIKLPTLPSLSLPNVPFPPSLGSSPFPELPSLPALPIDLANLLSSIELPYVAINKDGQNLLSSPVEVKIEVS